MTMQRTIAALRWVLLGLVTAVAGYTVWTFWGPAHEQQSAHEEPRFYCPMHPEIRSPEPGECPICHMSLEPIPAAHKAAAHDQEPQVAAAPPEVTTVTITADKQSAVGLVTSAVAEEALGERLRIPGILTAPETGLSQARTRAAGFVEKVDVRQTGVRVARGQVLAWIYSPEIYRAEEELLAATRWSTASSGSPSKTAGDIAAASRRGLELLGLSTADIDEIVRTGQPMRVIAVRAPSTGYVTRFNAVLGSRADPDTVLYEIADLSTLWVIASVHERDLAALSVGSIARFFVAGAARDPVTGKVDLVEPALDEATRSARVRIVLSNRDAKLRPGQFGEVELELPALHGLFVPRDAVIRTGEHEYVFVASGPDRFEPRSVRTGIARNDRVQVLEGIAPGERVVTRGTFMLDSESRLQASLASTPPSTATPAPSTP